MRRELGAKAAATGAATAWVLGRGSGSLAGLPSRGRAGLRLFSWCLHLSFTPCLSFCTAHSSVPSSLLGLAFEISPMEMIGKRVVEFGVDRL